MMVFVFSLMLTFYYTRIIPSEGRKLTVVFSCLFSTSILVERMVVQLPLGNFTICWSLEKLTSTNVFSFVFCLTNPKTFSFSKVKGINLPSLRLALFFLKRIMVLYRFKKDWRSFVSETTFFRLKSFSRGSQGSVLEKPPNCELSHCIGVRSGSRPKFKCFMLTAIGSFAFSSGISTFFIPNSSRSHTD